MFPLHEYQRRAVDAARAVPGNRWIFNEEMGLGKSLETLEILATDPRPTLIACPAIARSTWQREIHRWMPEQTSVGVINMGLERRSVSKKQKARLQNALSKDILVVSYSLLAKLLPMLGNRNRVVLDEVHWLAHHGAAWTKATRSLITKLSSDAQVLGLTGTMMPNMPLDACGIAETMWPGRFGGLSSKGDLSWKCKWRYSNASHNGYGWKFSGINPAYAEELRERLAATSSRTTVLEVGHLLKPLQTTYSTVDVSVVPGGSLENYLTSAALAKIPSVVAWVGNALLQTHHVAVLVYQRDTAAAMARAIAAEGNGEIPVYTITGEDTAEQRRALLDKAEADPRSVVVCTMSSIGLSIDMTFCNHVVIAELYPKPDLVAQAMKRFHRLNSKFPVFIHVMAAARTRDEAIANVLCEKLDSISQAAVLGGSEEALLAAVGSSGDFVEQVEKAFATMVDDPYDCALDEEE